MQRQPPERVECAVARRRAGPRPAASSGVNSAGSSGPSATRAAPVSVAQSSSSAGSSPSASASASARTSRPSASVLLISTVSPCACGARRPGRKALPPMLFSTAGISRRRRTGKRQRHDHRASASITAAPPMSFFISSMLLDGLMSSPPVSKHTPLPTSVSFGAAGSPQVRSIRRGARALARPTAWTAGIVLGEQVVADDRSGSRRRSARRPRPPRPRPARPGRDRWRAC